MYRLFLAAYPTATPANWPMPRRGEMDSIPLHHVVRRQLARLRAGLDLDGRVMHVIARAQLPAHIGHEPVAGMPAGNDQVHGERGFGDRKSTRLNSSHLGISYAVFCLKKKKKTNIT